MSRAVSVAEMKALETAALAAGWSEAQLMELAGQALGRRILELFPQRGQAIAFIGKGHNAGDALIALRVLRDAGWHIAVRAAYPVDALAPLTQTQLKALGEVDEQLAITHAPLLLLDGLLGIGAHGALRPPLRELAAEMQQLRERKGARVLAVDLPSGVDPDSGEIFDGAVIADITLTVSAPKRGLLLGNSAHAVGALSLIEVEPLVSHVPSAVEMIAPQTLRSSLPLRSFDFHKGQAGRLGLLAGSRAYAGAAVLAATGALRAGAGLITLHVPDDAAELVASRCPAEIMIRSYRELSELGEHRYDAVVCGPGLGTLDRDATHAMLAWAASQPNAVMDADALNAIAAHGGLEHLTAHHVLTPHPGEFKRLAADLANLPREEAARSFVDRCRATLLLKGSRTIVTNRNEALWCNSTGTPGMASGGQGDVLAGVIGALLAAGRDTLTAARLGAWLCGRAAERALMRQSEESLTAGDTAAALGLAFRDWRRGTR